MRRLSLILCMAVLACLGMHCEFKSDEDRLMDDTLVLLKAEEFEAALSVLGQLKDIQENKHGEDSFEHRATSLSIIRLNSRLGHSSEARLLAEELDALNKRSGKVDYLSEQTTQLLESLPQ